MSFEAETQTSHTPAFWHVGLTVSNIQKSVVFYRDAIGLKAQPVRKTDSEMLQTLFGTGEKTALAFTYMTSGLFCLQLVEYTAGAGTRANVAHNNSGSPHLSFYTSDIYEDFARIVAMGLTVLSDVIVNPSAKIRSFYVLDPDGVPVELVERL